MIEITNDTIPDIEHKLVTSSGDSDILMRLKDEFYQVYQSIQMQAALGAFTIEQLCLFDEQAARIKQIALVFSALERKRSDLMEKARYETECILSSGDPIVAHGSNNSKGASPNTPAVINTLQETLNSKVLRRWFLDNIADPFPNKKTKDELIAKTNALVEAAPPVKKRAAKSSPHAKSNQPIDYTQCSLWFVNSRRRSNWTDFFREYAHSDKTLMRRFVECLKREEGVEQPGKNKELEALLQSYAVKKEVDSDDSCSPQNEEEEMAARVRECRETYAHIMDWLQQISKDKVGDWMDEVIREAKQQVKEEKAARRQDMKRRAEALEHAHEERDKQRQKMRQDRQTLRAGPVNTRSTDRTLRRRVAERKERIDHRRVPVDFHTPDSNIKQTQFSDSSVRITSHGSTTWNSSADSQYAPSLFEKHALRSASSSSSLASYDNLQRVPASPTLSILKNSQTKLSLESTMKPIQIIPALPLANAASLYTSDTAPPYGPTGHLIVDPHPCTTPADRVHLETELSGGARSPVGRTVSQASSSSDSIGHSPWNGLQC